MRRFLKFMSAILAGAMCLGLAACGGGAPDNGGDTPSIEEPAPETPTEVAFTREYMQGKTVVVYGDSISSRSHLNDDDNDYLEILSYNLGFKLIRRALSGSALTYGTPVKSKLRSGVDFIASGKEDNKAADVAIVFYGGNDCNYNAQMGFENDDFSSYTEVDSFLGAINFSVKTLREHNPDIQILFLTAFYRYTQIGDDYVNAYGTPLTQYVNGVMVGAEVNGCRAINLYEGVGFDKENFYPNSELTQDGIHPNAAGQKVLADFLLTNDGEKASEPIPQENYLDVRLTREYMQGKKVVVYGDSISARAYLESDEKDYVDILSEELGFTFNRMSLRASRFTQVLPTSVTVRSGVDLISSNQTANAQADVAIIAYGVNDYISSVPIGSDNDNFQRWQDVSTFKGAINNAVRTLRAHNPKIRIVMLTPIFYGVRTNANGSGHTTVDYGNAVLDLASKNHYRAIEMYYSVGFTQENFYKDSTLTHDAAHPNAAGHGMMADRLLSVDAIKPNDVLFTREYFEGKRVVSYGDSISAKATLQSGESDYLENLSSALGFSYTRLGVSSSRFAAIYPVPGAYTVRTGMDIIYNSREDNEKADVALIAYGTNDFASEVPIGTDDDDFENWEDVNTFKGAINFAVKTLRAHNPDIRIVFLSPIYRGDKQVNGAGVSLALYTKALQDLSVKNDYRVVDMTYAGFNAGNFYKNSAFTNDALHPNAAGHAVMSNYVLGLDK